jgi:hypothetical protein
MRIQTSQRSGAYDAVDKLRVSSPQSLIDTDFEYGQQPSKWEQLDLENNRQSCWYNQNSPLAVTAITGNGTTTVVVSTTATVTVGTPVFIEDALDTNANGWWYVTASVGGTSFTILTTNTVATGNQWNAAATYVYTGNFYTGCGFAVTAASTTAITTSGTAITVNTAFPHGLAANSYVYIVGTTGGTGVNGAWVVATVPTSTQFTIATTGASGTVTTSGSSGNTQLNVYARPSGYVETRAYDGSVNFTAGAAVANQQMMRQTRRYFRYQSGKSIQFSTGSIMKPQLFTTSVTNGGSNSTVTVTTRWAHNMAVGAYIQVSGAAVPTYNGIFKVLTAPTATTLTYATANNVIPASSPALTTTGIPVSVSPYSWYGSSNKLGFFDFQNGLFFQFDGQTLYAVWRNSINQLSGTVSVTQSSGLVTGTGSVFTNQLVPGDYIVIRGQSYRVLNIASDTSLNISPEYRGATIANAVVSKTIDTKVPQSQWWDPLDGTGPSGYTLDLTKNQMWFIDYSWYGAGVARFGLRTTGGAIAYVYSFQSNNIQYQAYMRSGNLPSHYESNGQGAITTITASVATGDTSINVASVAGFNPAGGTLKVTGATAGAAIEYITYTSASGTTFSGLTRAATGGAATAQSFTYSATAPVSVEYTAPDIVAVISHWGSSVVMDGGFNTDVALIYNYGTTSAVNVPNNGTVPILAIRVAPSVDNGQVGTLGNKEVINRLQLQLRELGVVTSGTFLIQLNLNGYTNGGSPSWTSFTSPTQNNTVTSSIVQVASQTSTTATFTGGESIAAAFTNNSGQTTLDLTSVAGIGNSILGGGLSNTVPTSYAGQYPDGPDILYVVATNISGTSATIVARLSWQESQA